MDHCTEGWQTDHWVLCRLYSEATACGNIRDAAVDRETESLNTLRAQIRDDKPLRQVARLTNRILSDLEVKGTLRSAPEEFNLAVNMETQDVTAAEFIRTYQSVDFCGKDILLRLEREQRRAPGSIFVSMMRLPSVKVTAMSHVGSPPFVELYPLGRY